MPSVGRRRLPMVAHWRSRRWADNGPAEACFLGGRYMSLICSHMNYILWLLYIVIFSMLIKGTNKFNWTSSVCFNKIEEKKMKKKLFCNYTGQVCNIFYRYINIKYRPTFIFRDSESYILIFRDPFFVIFRDTWPQPPPLWASFSGQGFLGRQQPMLKLEVDYFCSSRLLKDIILNMMVHNMIPSLTSSKKGGNSIFLTF